MDHVAIMRPSWNLLPKILPGEKTIESRWYKNRSSPWGKIKSGDTIYFKDSGKPVTSKAQVAKVLEFQDLTTEKINQLRNKYQQEIGLKEEDLNGYQDFFKGKKYGILIYLKSPQPVKPFEINKKGFGIGAAWISISDINSIKL
jgi:ASC-1-like (ASCH) protein